MRSLLLIYRVQRSPFTHAKGDVDSKDYFVLSSNFFARFDGNVIEIIIDLNRIQIARITVLDKKRCVTERDRY